MKMPYETMFLLPPTTNEEQVDQFIGRLQESVEKKYGEMKQVQKMGVRKTAYTVNKLNSAYYVLIQYQGNGDTIHEVERMLKNSDEVLKYLSTKVTTKPSVVKNPTRPLEDQKPSETNTAESTETNLAAEVQSAEAEFSSEVPASAVVNGSKE